jgi:hypothetical protein
VKQQRKNKLRSPGLPGPAFTHQEFVSWIAQSEVMATVSLEEAKCGWAIRCDELQKLALLKF